MQNKTNEQFHVAEGITKSSARCRVIISCLSPFSLLCGRCRRQIGIGEKSVCVSILGFKLSMQHREVCSLQVMGKYHIISLNPHPN